jgi:hypothetical protein
MGVLNHGRKPSWDEAGQVWIVRSMAVALPFVAAALLVAALSALIGAPQ